ncbi:MAG: hypothetical protein NVS4B12_11770 [Ktedonobacteraceae bacterium]
MIVRKLSEHDFNALWTLRLQALIDNPEVFDASYEETLAYGNEWLLKRLREENETVYLGAFEEMLIGMIGFHREEGIKTRHKGHIFSAVP